TDETIIALTRVPGGWLTEVVINGAWTGPLLLDTGASVTLVSPAVARAAGVSIGPDTPMVEVQGIAGRTRGHLVTLSSIQVGEIEARGVRAVVAELPLGLHGLLGNSFLARYTFTLDPRGGAAAPAPGARPYRRDAPGARGAGLERGARPRDGTGNRAERFWEAPCFGPGLRGREGHVRPGRRHFEPRARDDGGGPSLHPVPQSQPAPLPPCPAALGAAHGARGAGGLGRGQSRLPD